MFSPGLLCYNEEMGNARNSTAGNRDKKSVKGSGFALRAFLALLGLATPLAAFAQRTLTVNIGTDADLDTIISNVLTYMLIFIELLAIVLFVAGAFLFAISRGKEEGLASAGTGKSLMFNSMIGLAVVLSAHAILRTLLFLLYS